MRLAFWTIGPALAALAIWACGDGDGSVTDIPPVGETVSSTPLALQASCDAIQDIDSYRYAIDLRLDSPAFEEPNPATPNPLSEFAEALADLFSNMQLEGSFVAPDRSEALLRFGDEELELRTIGDQSWIRVGATWQEQPTSPGEDVVLTPATVCEDVVEDLAPSLAAAAGEADVVNSIETVHYRLDEADLKGLPELLGRSGEEGLPSEFGVDVWLERNDGWPVRLEIAASDVQDGQPISLELFMEFSDIDDPAINIEPPPVSPAQT